MIARKYNKLYFKGKGCVGSFNSWVDEKGIIKMSEYIPRSKSFWEKVNTE